VRTPFATAQRSGRSSLIAALALVLGGVLLVVTVIAVTRGPDEPAPAAIQASGTVAADPLSRAIAQAQEQLRRNPDDARTWAELGSAYVEQARITGDPSYYERAQGALDRSMQVQPTANAEAMIGLGALANARHDFAGARDWAVQARELRPRTPAVYGVLADARHPPRHRLVHPGLVRPRAARPRRRRPSSPGQGAGERLRAG
jgi:cytochrome c-type biogenesis protein CcmH/NrfG